MPKPFADRKLYIEPDSNAARQAKEWEASDPEGSRLMLALAKQPLTRWVGEWESNPQKTVDDLITKGGEQLRSIAIYAIPQRDCGSLSAGGVKNADDYAAFIDKVAGGLKGRLAIVILEPDGLTVTHCLSSSQLAERHAMMSAAVGVLTKAGARVYVDCGDSDWVSARDVAVALKAAGVEKAAGFATNVAHFEYLKNEHEWAKDIRGIIGTDAHYVVDTARCGTGPHGTGDNRWCNPPTPTGCGPRPTLSPKVPGCDALLWVKSVGSSDGKAFGGPDAGQWWPAFGRRLAIDAVPPL